VSVKRSDGFEHMVRGADTALHQSTMFAKAVLWSSGLGVVVAVALFAIFSVSATSESERYLVAKYLVARLKQFFFLDHHPISLTVAGKSGAVSPQQIVSLTNSVASHVKNRLWVPAGIGGIGGVAASMGLLFYWRKRGATQAEDEFIRGAQLAEGGELRRSLEADDNVSRVEVAGVPFRKGSETLHAVVSGAVGTGKSVGILDILDSVRLQGKRAIVYDPTGEFTEQFFRTDRDVVLNPLDARSPNWSLWREIRNDFDYRTFASALIPILSKNEPFFDQSARTVGEELFRRLAERGQATNKALYDAAARLTLEELHALLAGTGGAALIDPAAEKTALSIRSTLLNAINGVRYLHDTGDVFSIRQWIENDNTDSWLFVTSRKDQHEAIKPLITLWLDIAIRGVMNLPPVREPRFWLVVDELPSLQKIDALQTAVAETRKYGLCGVFGIQSVSQMREIYGRDGAQTIMGMCQTWIVLRVADAETARYLSETLGLMEIQEKDEGLSFGAEANRDGTNLSSRRAQKAIVLPSEIQHLADLHGYMRVPGNYPVGRIQLSFKQREKLAPAFMPRERPSLEAMGL
jgi:type IV conjugative transfer system coupling protein TraD